MGTWGIAAAMQRANEQFDQQKRGWRRVISKQTRIATRQTPRLSLATGQPITAAEVQPQMEILFQRAIQQAGRYHPRLTKNDLPLHQGDKLRLHVTLPKPTYVYLYLCDGHSRQRLYPEPGQSGPRRHRFRRCFRFSPMSSQKLPIVGPPATEMALLAMSDSPLTAAALERFDATECHLSAGAATLQPIIYPLPSTDDKSGN